MLTTTYYSLLHPSTVVQVTDPNTANPNPNPNPNPDPNSNPYFNPNPNSNPNPNTILPQECKSRIPIQIKKTVTGVSLPNVFASEFGCIGM